MDDLLYLYGLMPTEETAVQSFPSIKGFDGMGEIYRIPIEDITAIVCHIDSKRYTRDRIEDLIQHDMEWLEEKAFHHHETVMNLSGMSTLIPLKFCTIYKNKTNLETAVKKNKAKLLDTFSLISGNEEWNIKIYCEDERLKEYVAHSNPVIEAKRAELSRLSKGRQFFEKKKLEKMIDTQLDGEKNRTCEIIHKKLAEMARKANVKETWRHQLEGRNTQMAWNGVYLLSKSKVEPFLKQIQQYESVMQEKGWHFAATGPWPAYHFSSFS